MNDPVAYQRTLVTKTGPLAWFANNSVAANVLMLLIMGAGFFFATQLRQEVFPEVQFPVVVVSIPYPGASPEEVESGVVLAVEEAIRDVDGVKEVNSTASEGFATIAAELEDGVDENKGLADIKSAVDRVTSLPADVERSNVFLATNRTRIVSIVVNGELNMKELRAMAESMRSRLVEDDRISVAEVIGTPDPEIAVEVRQEDLRRYGLTLEQVAGRIRAASIDLPAGAVKTERGEILLRTTERRESGSEFANIVLVSRPDGTEVHVGDVATVIDGFQETDRAAFYNGKPAAMIDVFRVNEERPLDISEAVKEFLEKEKSALPGGVEASIWYDSSDLYRDRVDLLRRNAIYGFILVLLVLSLFLEIRLAFWVTLGIPISFIGAFLVLPLVGVSINMISLFAFIIVLGMVVDDAIVIGEAIYFNREAGMSPLEASIAGVREMAVPVFFAVLTTIIAFSPLLYVPGFAGKFFVNIPWVVISVLIISLVESLIILPAHLAHSKPPSERGTFGFIHHQQQKFAKLIDWVVARTYVPSLKFLTERRYLGAAIGVAVLVATIGLVAGGRVHFVFMPKIESDLAVATVELPYGSNPDDTRVIKQRIEDTLNASLKELARPEDIKGIFSQMGASTIGGGGGPSGGKTSLGGHIAEVAVYLVGLGERDFTTTQLTALWRKKLGDIAGVESLKFKDSTGGSGEAPVAFNLTHPDNTKLEAAAKELAARLSSYAGVFDINDGQESGKEQLDITLKPAARRLGLSEMDVARQIRSTFFGAEAARQQRGRDELRVYVRYPRSERSSEATLEKMLLRTPSGGEIPLSLAVNLKEGRAYTTIQRFQYQRILKVSSDLDFSVGNATTITQDVIENDLPELQSKYPGLTYRMSGEQLRQAETMGGLSKLFLVAILVMYALLAIAFKSYMQPVLIMTAIPFGFVGALGGHLFMGYDLSLISMMGLVALAGVVVNDSLVLIVTINELRDREGLSAMEACRAAGQRRFRPIILTSLTTFFGLIPMIFETSMQARFLIPMALSLGFGVMFATFITLGLIPSFYLILEDLAAGISFAWRWLWADKKEQELRPAPAKEQG